MTDNEQDQPAIDHQSKPNSIPKSTPRRDRISKRPPKHWKPSKTAVNPTKTKIRDITRRLERPEKLPADIQVEKERALVGYRQDLERIEAAKRRKKIIGRYHMVRFFERQKATRAVKRLQKRLATLPADSPEYLAVQEEADIAAIDLDYTLYHPLEQKYIGIYPKPPPPPEETDEKSGDKNEQGGIEQPENPRAAKPQMWHVVARCRESGQLEALREGRLGDGGELEVGEGEGGAGSLNIKAEKGKKGKKEALREVEGEELEGEGGEESDGGFFDE